MTLEGYDLTELEREHHVETWFERDRQHVALYDSKDKKVVEWWDEDVSQAVEDGFLSARDWKGSAIRYAVDMGLMKRWRVDRPMRRRAERRRMSRT
jgi:hypothetical protein